VYHLLGGIYLGWSLGANDAANVFGTAVTSRMVSFFTASVLCAGFVALGSVLEGQAGITTIGSLAEQSLYTATVTSVGAAVSITAMTLLRIPSSTSQAVVGSIIGVGLISGSALHLSGLIKVAACWVGTPIGGLIAAMILYRGLGSALNRLRPNIYAYDELMRIGLVLAGAYGAYALGANNVANVTGVYVRAGLLTPFWGMVIGGLSIALGVITYSKPVMMTVGKSIVRLDAFSALVVVLAEAVVVHIYAWVGVPVSTSQAVVGAVIGVGLIKQASAIKSSVVYRIAGGWLVTPVIAGLVAAAIYFVTHLRYVA
jgi:PiT family inorganic phosphate transporter